MPDCLGATLTLWQKVCQMKLACFGRESQRGPKMARTDAEWQSSEDSETRHQRVVLEYLYAILHHCHIVTQWGCCIPLPTIYPSVSRIRLSDVKSATFYLLVSFHQIENFLSLRGVHDRHLFNFISWKVEWHLVLFKRLTSDALFGKQNSFLPSSFFFSHFLISPFLFSASVSFPPFITPPLPPFSSRFSYSPL